MHREPIATYRLQWRGGRAEVTDLDEVKLLPKEGRFRANNDLLKVEKRGFQKAERRRERGSGDCAPKRLLRVSVGRGGAAPSSGGNRHVPAEASLPPVLAADPPPRWASEKKRDVRKTSMSHNTTGILLTLWMAQIRNVG